MREIVINAIVHNDYYTNEVPPKFEIFSDRIEITSAGRLPIGMTKEEFLIGLNFSSKTRRLEEWQIGQKSTGKDVQKSTGKDVQKSTGKKLGKKRNIGKHTSNLQAKGIIRRVDGRKEGYWKVLI